MCIRDSPKAVSSIEGLCNGSFRTVIDDKIIDKDNVDNIVLCSGKVYYELEQRKKETKIENMAIIRIEQLYPFPYDNLEELLVTYKNVNEVKWCQEEPSNQGAWFSHRHRLQRVLDRLKNKKIEIKLVSRPPAAAPAVGMMKLHQQQQDKLINEALEIKK